MNQIAKFSMIKELPFDERPREKMICLGAFYLSNAELLAILIEQEQRSISYYIG